MDFLIKREKAANRHGKYRLVSNLQIQYHADVRGRPAVQLDLVLQNKHGRNNLSTTMYRSDHLDACTDDAQVSLSSPDDS